MNQDQDQGPGLSRLPKNFRHSPKVERSSSAGAEAQVDFVALAARLQVVPCYKQPEQRSFSAAREVVRCYKTTKARFFIPCKGSPRRRLLVRSFGSPCPVLVPRQFSGAMGRLSRDCNQTKLS